jgi:hypothetical protein
MSSRLTGWGRGVEAMDNSYALLDLRVHGRKETWEDCSTSPSAAPGRHRLLGRHGQNTTGQGCSIRFLPTRPEELERPWGKPEEAEFSNSRGVPTPFAARITTSAGWNRSTPFARPRERLHHSIRSAHLLLPGFTARVRHTPGLRARRGPGDGERITSRPATQLYRALEEDTNRFAKPSTKGTQVVKTCYRRHNSGRMVSDGKNGD